LRGSALAVADGGDKEVVWLLIKSGTNVGTPQRSNEKYGAL
jgi:hypothetical protein